MSQDNPPLRPHEEIWYNDGNVLLIAETTSFRVHKSILARHSEFFHDMFNLPQPPQDDPNTGEAQCPTVHTSETAQDLAYFLGAIYNSVKFFRKDTQLSYAAVRAILKLSQKFSSELLRTFAVGRLQAAFPRKFCEWEALAQREVPQPIIYEVCDLPSMANLAQELELVDVLPVILYDCCQLSLDWILGGIPREPEGFEGSGDRNHEEGRHVREEVECLSRENQKAVLTARSRLTLATVTMLGGLGYVRDGLCDQYTCTSALREIGMGGLVKGDAVFDPLTALNRELAADPVPVQPPGIFGQIAPPMGQQQGIDILCRACRESCRNHLRISRERILKNIEEYIPVDFLQAANDANGTQQVS